MKTLQQKNILLQAAFFSICQLFAIEINAQQMYINPNTSLVLNGDVALVLNDASLNNNGIIVPTTSTVYFGGYADTTISNISGTSRTTLTNLTINKQAYGMAVKSQVDITNTLTMQTGNLYPDSSLTLKSTAANTARVASVPATCYILGKTIIERYIPARRAWRLLTAPISNTNTIYNTWQNSGVYMPNKGMYVTGPNPTGGAGNGLDTSIQNNISMSRWNVATQSFQGVSNTHVSISAGSNGNADNTGYMTFVRGDRTYSNFSIPNYNQTTLVSAGVLQTGSQSFSVSASAGSYSLIGNPYASPIDFNAVTRTNVIKRFYVWDPALNMLGGYVMLDDLDNDGSYSKTAAGSNQNKYLQSGQAFFVQTLAAAPASVTINESSKSASISNVGFRPAASVQSLRMVLKLPQDNSNSILADAVLAEFKDDFEDAVTLDDALKFGNINEEISLVRHGKTLTAERRPLIISTDTLFVKLNKTTQRNYQLELQLENFQQPGITAVLEDNFLHSSTAIDISSPTLYNFNVTADIASTGANRFRIVFRQGYVVLPVNFTSVSATRNSAGVSVNWQVANEINMDHYEVERSLNGSSFRNIGNVKATSNDYTQINYSLEDRSVRAGVIFYRIKSIDKTGAVGYSQVVRVADNGTEKSITVYPNPVTDHIINVQFLHQLAGTYSLELLSASGQLVVSEERYINSLLTVCSLQLPATLTPGIYQLKITDPAGTVTIKRVQVQ